jgi:hypothetical protein
VDIAPCPKSANCESDEAIVRVRATDPSTYFRVVASLMPKDVAVTIDQRPAAVRATWI